ncbi:MAG: hypothetical protein GX259_02070 [Bacteroidales bacterium]|nr:hypothetical protein [Bacteroidales bacterium]
MKEIIKRSIFKNGLYAGGILAAYFLIIYLIGINFYKMSFVTFLIQTAVILTFMFKGISSARKQSSEQKINTLSAIMIAVNVMFISLMCFFTMKMLILFVIDFGYNEFCINEIYLQTLQVMNSFPQYADKMGNPEDIKQILIFKNNLVYIVYYFITSVVIGSLAGLVAKKKNRLEDNI